MTLPRCWNQNRCIGMTIWISWVHLRSRLSVSLQVIPIRTRAPKYKDDEDARFGADLFVNVVEHYDEYRDLVDRYVDNQAWDSERLAFMDVVIMAAAIAEMLNYPQIPIPVTLNEYIEIANSYSTPRSGKFINGVLYSIISHLKEEGKLMRN